MRPRRLIAISLVLVALGVVAFLLRRPAAAEARVNAVRPVALLEIDPATARLHAGATIVDLHADTLLWSRDPLARGTRGQADLPRLLEGNVALQVFAAVTRAPTGPDYQHGRDRVLPLVVLQGWPPRSWFDLEARALHQADRLARAERRSGGRLRIVRTAGDLDGLGAGTLHALLAIEGLHALGGDPAALERLHAAGFRMMGLAHFFDNEVAGSSWGGERHGLTDLGRELVPRMEALGIAVDLAHASPRAIHDVLAIATKPVVVSHTGVQATCPTPRNLSDAEIRGIAATGGVIGIGFFEGAVCGTAPARIARAMRHVAELVGVEHVALGSDFDGAVATAFDAAGLVQVTQALVEAGFASAEIEAILGGNALRVLRATLPPGGEAGR